MAAGLAWLPNKLLLIAEKTFQELESCEEEGEEEEVCKMSLQCYQLITDLLAEVFAGIHPVAWSGGCNLVVMMMVAVEGG